MMWTCEVSEDMQSKKINHRVVTMVANKLKKQWLCIVYLLTALDNQRGSSPEALIMHL